MNTHTRSWVSMHRILPRLIAVVVCVSILALITTDTAAAATGVPRIMNYQGRLMNSSGSLLGGSGTDYCVKFSIYDDAAVGGSDTKLWPAGSPSTMTVNVKNGIFNAGVGDTNAGGDTLNFDFESNDAVYLNVEVAAKVGSTCAPGDGAESFENLSPRQRVTSSGYAINSATLNGQNGAYYRANSYSTTSAAYDLSTYNKGYFFSTTSVVYWDSTQTRWATTSTDAWFATKTTDQLAQGSSNLYYSNSLVNSFVHGSSTIPKTYTGNTFTGTNSFTNDVSLTNATTSNFNITNTISGAGLSSCSGSSDKLTWNATTRQFGCGADAGAGGGITSIGAQYSVFQTGPSQTLATSSDTNIGITITSSGDTHTFTPSWIGTLSGSRGGTGIGTVSQNGLLIGGAGNTWAQVATSSLGLPTYGDLGAYLGLAAWYATTTDALAEGSNNKYFTTNRLATELAATTTDAIAEGTNNKYYTDNRVQTYLNGITKGFFFSTTSASNFAAAGLAFSTTSTDYWKTQTNFHSTTSFAYSLSTYDKGFFFSTTSVAYWDSTQFRWATTSTDAWFATKDTDDLPEGTTNYYYTDARVNAYVAGSSTIPKTFANNAFTGTNSFTSLVANNGTFGTLSATTSATSTFEGPVLFGTTSASYRYSFMGQATAPTGATGTAIVAISNDNNTLSSGNNVLRLNMRTPYGTACVTGTTCPRFMEFFAGVSSGSDTGGRGVGSLRLSTAGTGITQTSGSADFAEYMQLSESAEVGDIVSLNSSGQYGKAVAGESLIGVISDNPAFVGNAGLEGQPNAYIVGFAGVIRTTVSASNGSISAGDLIAASDVPGVGIKLSESGYALGQALQNFSGPGTGTISVLVLPKFVDAAIALESYGGGASGTSGYWDLSTSTNTVSLSTSTYALSVAGNTTLTNATTSALKTNVFSIGGVDYFTSLTGSGLQNSGGLLALDRTGDWTGTLDGRDGSYYLANSFSTTSAQYFAAAGLAFSTTSAQYFASQNAGQSHSTTSTAYQLSTYDKGFFFSTSSTDYWKSQTNFFSTTSTDFWRTQNNFFSTTSASYFSSLGLAFSTTSAQYFLGQNDSSFSTTSANYFLNSSTTVPKTYSNNTFTGSNDFQNITATNATSTTSFTGTASSSNLFSNIANIGSLIAGAFTGNVVTATNATTTTLYAGTASSTNTYANTATVGTASIGSASVNSLTLGNALSGANGGTGISSVTQNALLIGGPGNTWTQISTSSLGLVAFGDLGAYMGLAQWYATTTDALAEGSNNKYFTVNRVASALAATTTDAIAEGSNNKYYTDGRVQTYLDGLSKGFFFSTTSASHFAAAGLAFSTTSSDHWLTTKSLSAFSTTSADYWKTQNNFHSTTSVAYNLATYDKGFFFSTTSVAYWDSTQFRWATTSTDAWFATKSTTNLPEGTNLYYTPNRVAGVIAGTTTDALAEGSTNRYFSNGLVDQYLAASSTVPKTFANNTFTGTNAFGNITASGATTTSLNTNSASTSNLVISTLQNSMLYTGPGGVVSAASVSGPLSFSTGTLSIQTASAVQAGALAAADFSSFNSRLSTSSLGLVDKGFFFSTTSTDFWKSQTNFFSTTSTDFWKTQNNFFSTTSASHFSALGLAFSTTSASYFLGQNQGAAFSTTSASHFASAGLAFSTTSAAYFNSQNQSQSFSTSSTNYYMQSSTTVPTTYKNNTFAGTNAFADITAAGATTTSLNTNTASTSNLVISTLQNSMLYTGPGGIVSSATVSGPLSFSTGSLSIQTASAAQAGALAAGDFSAFNSRLSTSSLGLVDKGFFFSTTSASVFSAAGLAFSTTSTDYWRSVNNFFSTTSASHFSALGLAFSTTSTAYFLGQNQGLAFSTTSANYFVENTAALPKTNTNNTYTGTNAFANITATNATTTTLFASSASTTDLRANTASFGSATAGTLAVTGSATSTFQNGIDLANGCFSVNGTCIGAAQGGGGSGTIINIQVFSTPGTTTYTPSAGATSAQVIVTGGGGGGGGADSTDGTTTEIPAGGGGSGGTSIAFVDLTSTTSVQVVVGTGGAGGPATGGTGITGARSSFGPSIAVADGGVGGTGATDSTAGPRTLAGGAGGAASAGNMNVSGGYGQDGNSQVGNTAFGGDGGSGYWGGGGDGGSVVVTAASSAGTNASAYGAGGGGAALADTATGAAGGNGAGGVVVVYEYGPFTGIMNVANGGTGLSSVGYGQLLMGNASGGYDLVSTSSLGYATTTDSLGEGATNKYYTDARVNTYVGASTTIAKTFTANIFTALQTFANAIFSNATSTNFAATGVASSTNLVASNSFTFGKFSGILKATAGSVVAALVDLASDVTGVLGISNGGTGTSTAPALGQLLVGNALGGYNLVATSTLGIYVGDLVGTVDETQGGTGNTSYTAGDILYALNGSTLVRLPAGGNGSVLKMAGGLPAWGTDLQSGGGGGGGSGFFSTTTDNLAIYPSDPTDVVVVGNSATGTADSQLEVFGKAYFSNRVGIATSSAGSIFSIGGVANFSSLGSSMYTKLNLIDLQATGDSAFANVLAANVAAASVGGSTLSAGTNATTTIQGDATGTSTIQGFINVTGTNSTSTFSGSLQALSIRLTATSTASGFNMTSGCYAINGVCTVNSLTATNTTLTTSGTNGAVGISLNLANPNLWTGLQQFGNATSSLLEATQFYARTIQSTSSNALALKSNLSSTAGLTFGSTSTPNVLGIDTINNRVTLGTGGGTPTWLVLDTKNTPGDPATGVNGAMYYNSNSSAFRCYNGSWVTCGGQAASSTGDVQFRNIDGSFTATSNFNWSQAGNGLTLTGSSTTQTLDLLTVASSTGRAMFGVSGMGVVSLSTTTDPATPSSGELSLYAKDLAGRVIPKWVGPAGLDTPIQAAIWRNNMVYFTPGAAAGVWTGTIGANLGTPTVSLPTTTNFYTNLRRSQFPTVVTTTNQQVGTRSEAMFFRGATAGQGGFFFAARIGFETWTAGDRLFVGFSTGTTAVCTGDPTALTNTVGFAINAGSTTINFIHNDNTGAATVDLISGQPALATNNGYEFYIFAKPNDTTIYWELVDLNTGLKINAGQTSTDLPVNTTMMAAHGCMSNGANTAANAARIGINRIYIETDH